MGKAARRLLDRLFSPRSVALFGSVKEGKIGYQLLTQIVSGGYSGRLWAVNPGGSSPEEFTAVDGTADINEIAEPVDLAIISVPARYVEETVAKCAAKHIPFGVVLSSGFSEIGNRAGEDRLRQIAVEHGIRLIGPNCAGIMDTLCPLFASIEVKALPGRTAFITQSGAVGGAVLAMAEQQGVGFSKFVSYGNRVDIDEIELLNYLETDDNTDVIALYLESIENGREFLRTVQRISRCKPVVIIKSGKSTAGLRAASSHTGSMAGSDRVFEAALKESGAVRASGIEEMLDICSGFTGLSPLRGQKIAIVTNSGGPGILTTDRAEELGLDVAEPGEALKKGLASALPAHASLNNPIDLTVEGTAENFRQALTDALAGDYDGAIAINVGTPFLDSSELAAGIIEAAEGLKVKKPIAPVFMAGRIVEKGLSLFREHGLPCFSTGERAALVLSRLYAYHRAREQQQESPGSDVVKTDKLPFAFPVLEPRLVSFLESRNFPLPRNCFVSCSKELEAAAGHLGFPVVMKIVSPEIIHKSDSGGVILNIRDIKELKSKFSGIEKSFSEFDFRGVMLYEQLPNPFEIIIGMKRDADFGPVLLAGAGGIYTEILNDISLRIAPVDLARAMEMLAELKIHKLLCGHRGGPKLDMEAAARLIVELSGLSMEFPDIEEVDFNPVFVFEKGVLIGDLRFSG